MWKEVMNADYQTNRIYITLKLIATIHIVYMKYLGEYYVYTRSMTESTVHSI